MNPLLRILTHPAPHLALIRRFLAAVPLFSCEDRIEAGAVDRPHYAYCLLSAARLAKRLGHRRLSAIEFGVAGGRGLLALERHAVAVEKITGLQIEVYGFDSGAGLPEPRDYKDLPYHFKASFYRMDRPALEARLQRARLVIGDVRETCRSFFSQYAPAPIGCIFNDLDYYSSTRDS